MFTYNRSNITHLIRVNNIDQAMKVVAGPKLTPQIHLCITLIHNLKNNYIYIWCNSVQFSELIHCLKGLVKWS